MKGRVCVCVRSLLCERAALHVRMEKMGAVYGTAESSERERERESCTLLRFCSPTHYEHYFSYSLSPLSH